MPRVGSDLDNNTYDEHIDLLQKNILKWPNFMYCDSLSIES